MRPVRVLGLDGMSLPILRELIDLGLMPEAAKFLKACHALPLRSTVPFSTIPGWASIFTGVLPGEHGLLWWKREDPWLPWAPPRGKGFTSFHDPPQPAIWDLTTLMGYEAAFLDIPASFPAPSTKGLFVSGFLGPWPHPLAVSPPELRSQTSNWLQSNGGIGRSSGFPTEDLGRAIDALTDATRQRLELYASTFRDSCQLTFQVLVGPDRLSHWCWQDLVPQPGRRLEIRQSVGRYWQVVDEYFLALNEARDRGESVLVCSDHGSTAPPRLRFQLMPWLIEHAYAPAPRSEKSARAARRFGAGLDMVRHGLRPVVRKLGMQNAARRMRDQARNLIWEASQARWEDVTVFPTVLGDHEAGFFIHPRVADRESVGGTIASQLRLETYEGSKIFSEVGPADQFLGPIRRGDRIPDLLAVTHGEIGVADGMHQGTVLTEEANGARGVHHRSGLLLIWSEEPLIDQEPGVEDIAPTILALLDIQPPVWMQGSSLLNLTPTKVLPKVGTRSPSAEPELSAEEEEAIEDHLRGLGYVE